MGSRRSEKVIGGELMLRSSRFEPAFDASLSRIFDGQSDKADDRIRAVEWTLSRAMEFPPATFPPLGRTQDGIAIRLYKTVATPFFPPLLIVFGISVDDQMVIYYDIQPGQSVAETAPPQPVHTATAEGAADQS